MTLRRIGSDNGQHMYSVAWGTDTCWFIVNVVMCLVVKTDLVI